MKRIASWVVGLFLFLIALPAGGSADVFYTVRRGDTIHSIAYLFSVPAWQLKIANNIDDDNRIRHGQSLHIPRGMRCNLYKIGEASWYGPGFHGNPTKSGVQYDQNHISVACDDRDEHLLGRWLLIQLDSQKIEPKGTIRGHELGGDWFVSALVIDTGAFGRKYGRVADLSKKAMQKLGGHAAVKAGVVPVKVFVCG